MNGKLKAGQKKCLKCKTPNPIRIFMCRKCSYRFSDKEAKYKKNNQKSISGFVIRKTKVEISLDSVFDTYTKETDFTFNKSKFEGSKRMLTFYVYRHLVFTLFLVEEKVFVEISRFDQINRIFIYELSLKEGPVKHLDIAGIQNYLMITVNSTMLLVKCEDDNTLKAIDKLEIKNREEYNSDLNITSVSLKMKERNAFMIVADSSYRMHLYKAIGGKKEGLVYQHTYDNFFYAKIVNLQFLHLDSEENIFFSAASLDGNLAVFSIFDCFSEIYRYKVSEVWITKMLFCPIDDLILFSVDHPDSIYCLKFSTKPIKIKRINPTKNIIDFIEFEGNLFFLDKNGQFSMINNKMLKVFSGINKTKPMVTALFEAKQAEKFTVSRWSEGMKLVWSEKNKVKTKTIIEI